MSESNYVRVKLSHSEENKDKGFYLLMTNGNTYSDEEDVFVIDRKYLDVLKENNIKYDELPLNKE